MVIGLWFMFAPTQLGGQVSYVILNGNSMEPGMHRGDLAVVKRSSSYVAGDVVTYRHPDIGNVIHRIVNWDGERYTLQGDNNDFLDPYEPVESDIVGELWFHVPGVGGFLTRFQHPVYLAGLLIVALLGVGGAAAVADSRRRKRRRRRHGQPVSGLTSGSSTMSALRKNAMDLSLVLAVTVVVFGGLAYMAFSRTTTKQVDEAVMYSHSGQFNYEASSRSPGVYDTGEALSGDPVFAILSQRISIDYAYEFITEASADVDGTIGLTARITAENGWTRTVPVAEPAEFQGTQATTSGVLDLGSVAELVRIVETESGVANRSYEILISPAVTLAGTLDGSPLALTHDPALALTFDHSQLFVSHSNGDETDPLAPTEAGTALVQTTVPATMSLLSWSANVSTVRWASLAGLGAALFAAAVLALGLAATISTGDGSDGPVMRLGVMVLPIQSDPALQSPAVELTSFEDIAAVAARMDGIVLEAGEGPIRAYYVHDQYVTYRYREVAAPSPMPLNRGLGRAA